MVANKPADLLIHRTSIDRHETRFMLQALRDQLGRHLYPVHRLDKPTSGAVIFAFSSAAAAALQHQLQENIASKNYLLICRGFSPVAAEIDYPLRRLEDKKRKAQRDSECVSRQEAITRIQRVATTTVDVAIDKYPQARYSLVSAQLLTGRQHQIRRHFKHISHPIVGCAKYGKSSHNRFFAEQLGAPGLMLHARSLCFQPIGQQDIIHIRAPLPERFERVISALDWTYDTDTELRGEI